MFVFHLATSHLVLSRPNASQRPWPIPRQSGSHMLIRSSSRSFTNCQWLSRPNKHKEHDIASSSMPWSIPVHSKLKEYLIATTVSFVEMTYRLFCVLSCCLHGWLLPCDSHLNDTGSPAMKEAHYLWCRPPGVIDSKANIALDREIILLISPSPLTWHMWHILTGWV